MKIGIVLSSTPGYSETFFYSKIKGLQENGFQVTLFCQQKAGQFNLCPVKLSPKLYKNPILQLGAFLLTFVSLLPYAKRIIRFFQLEQKEGTPTSTILKEIYLNAHLLKARLDWVHFGFATQALGKELVAKSIGAKAAVSFRGFDIGVYPIKHPGCYHKLWRHIDKVHSISNDLYEKALTLGLSSSIPYRKITPAIDVSFFSNSIKKEFFYADKIRFLTIARLNWKKGYIEMLEALKYIKDKGVKFQYTIIGEGKEYERIAYTAAELDIKSSINFIGKQNKKTIKDYLSNTDVYIQYSLQEGFCNAVLEAQAMGCLCVVSDAEGLSENVLNKQTGWVVKKFSSELLAKQIIEVIHLSTAEKEKIANAAAKRVKKEFSIERQQKMFVEFYKKDT